MKLASMMLQRFPWSAAAGTGAAICIGLHWAEKRKAFAASAATAAHASGRAYRHYPPGDDYPDLEYHHNIMARALTSQLYAKLRDLTTKNGVTLDHCIQTGVDNPGHPMIRTCGIVAGDYDSYNVFGELFNKVIELRHQGFQRGTNRHQNDLDFTKLKEGNFDPDYVMSVRIRTVRNLRGFNLPPALTRAERRHVQAVIANAVKKLTGDLKGRYYPYKFLTPEEQQDLLDKSILFERPSTQVHLSSGLTRDWPDSRGVFYNHAQTFAVWVNECEDHIKVISLHSGGNLKEAFERFCVGVRDIEQNMMKDGYSFMHDDELGYISTCPSNLGTGLRASVYLKLDYLATDPRFSTITKRLNLHKRRVVPSQNYYSDNNDRLSSSSGNNGNDASSHIFDISNVERLGHSEVELMQRLVEGIQMLIKMDKKLAQGKSIDPLLA